MEMRQCKRSQSNSNVKRRKADGTIRAHVGAGRNTKNVTVRRWRGSMRVKVEKRPILVPGFRFAGVACGIKSSGRKDLALIVSDVPATAAAAFTTNKSTSAAVLVGRDRVKAGRLQAVVVNSGIANVATGQPGIRLASD